MHSYMPKVPLSATWQWRGSKVALEMKHYLKENASFLFKHLFTRAISRVGFPRAFPFRSVSNLLYWMALTFSRPEGWGSTEKAMVRKNAWCGLDAFTSIDSASYLWSSPVCSRSSLWFFSYCLFECKWMWECVCDIFTRFILVVITLQTLFGIGILSYCFYFCSTHAENTQNTWCIWDYKEYTVPQCNGLDVSSMMLTSLSLDFLFTLN